MGYIAILFRDTSFLVPVPTLLQIYHIFINIKKTLHTYSQFVDGKNIRVCSLVTTCHQKLNVLNCFDEISTDITDIIIFYSVFQ